MIDMRLGDCMDLMRGLPDKAFDLAIVDPEYGVDVGVGLGKWLRQRGVKETHWDKEIPSPEYFAELARVSKHQIIFGGNYFPLPPSRCFVIWDKGEGFKDRSYAECELAWCSFDANAAIFKHDPLANGDYKGKIHITQKPVALYKWLLTKYAKPGWTIIDTHGGSGSIAIACHDLGFDLTWIEKDEDYYNAAVKRYQTHASQLSLFEEPKKVESEQGDLL